MKMMSHFRIVEPFLVDSHFPFVATNVDDQIPIRIKKKEKIFLIFESKIFEKLLQKFF